MPAWTARKTVGGWATKATSVTLNSGSSGGTGATLTWAQISGPSVGALSGDSPTFTAPDEVTVLGFELTASDGTTTEVDSVRVWVLEDADQVVRLEYRYDGFKEEFSSILQRQAHD